MWSSDCGNFVMLYHRMEKLLNGMEDVANGKLDVEIPLENSGEYKVIYENFNQMVRELKNADEQQKQFMKDFSHEFKTPIHSIKGMAEYLLHNEIPREEEKEYLNVMAKEAGRWRSYHKIHCCYQNWSIWKCFGKKKNSGSIPRFVTARYFYCHLLKKKTFCWKPNCQNEILWQRGIHERGLGNLLDNARKYSPEGTRVFIEGKVTEKDLWIT